MNWRDTWHPAIELTPLEGRRGAGEHAGLFGLATFAGAGVYPACSHHGAMNCVRRSDESGESLWRCLVEGCNIGAVWSP